MPSYLRGKKRDRLTFVKVNDSKLYYGWNAKNIVSAQQIDATDITALGHLDATAAKAVSGSICILGARNPKPPRVRKVVSPNTLSPDVQESFSTFCAYDKISDALVLDWKPAGRARGVSVRQNTRSITAGAKIDFGGGVVGYYLFSINASDAALAEFAALGLELAGAGLSNAEIKKGFAATSYPRPASAVFGREDGTTFSSFCSFDSISNAMQAGWSILEGSPAPVIHSGGGGGTP